MALLAPASTLRLKLTRSDCASRACGWAVSYTHLDVYKRQMVAASACRSSGACAISTAGACAWCPGRNAASSPPCPSPESVRQQRRPRRRRFDASCGCALQTYSSHPCSSGVVPSNRPKNSVCIWRVSRPATPSPMIRPSTERIGVISVSYTHLDVYKRQGPRVPGRRRSLASPGLPQGVGGPRVRRTDRSGSRTTPVDPARPGW